MSVSCYSCCYCKENFTTTYI